MYTEDGKPHPVSTEELPVRLPHIEAYRPTADGEPLARAEEWRKTEWNGQPALRETNTMPQWAGSCWYYQDIWMQEIRMLHFLEAVQYWKNVDIYRWGRACGIASLYARFWHKVLYDCGLVPTKEPFQQLFNQGMILAYSYRDALGKYHHPSEVEQRGDRYFVLGTDTEVFSQVEKMFKSKRNTGFT